MMILRSSLELNLMKTQSQRWVKVDLQYVEDNPSPSPEFLKENVITKAIENGGKCQGKTGHDMLNMFTKQTDMLQCCKSCVEKTSASMLISQCNRSICQRTCEVCREQKEVRADCQMDGETSYAPALRACRNFLKPQLHKRFFARIGHAIFFKFCHVASARVATRVTNSS